MSIGSVSLNTSHKKEPAPAPGPPGPPFLPTSADNGLSVDAVSGKIVLGNEFADPAQPAALLDLREIDLNQTDIFFDLFGNANSAGGFEALALGINPFAGIAGISFNTNYSLYDPTANLLIGINFNAADIGSQSGWFRGFGNDNFVMGTMFSSGDTLPAARFIMFDSGNVTLNSQVNAYPQSQDIDTGITYFVFGSMGMQLLPAAGANPITSVGWDTVTGELLANIDAKFDSISVDDGSGNTTNIFGSEVVITTNGADWSSQSADLILQNSTNQFEIVGTNNVGLGGDIVQLTFNNDATIDMLLSGNFLFSNLSSGALADSGSLAQFFGNVDVNGNLNVSSGASGSFTTVDLKTVTVTNGIVTSIV